jgi:hypothetical protein
MESPDKTLTTCVNDFPQRTGAWVSGTARPCSDYDRPENRFGQQDPVWEPLKDLINC